MLQLFILSIFVVSIAIAAMAVKMFFVKGFSIKKECSCGRNETEIDCSTVCDDHNKIHGDTY